MSTERECRVIVSSRARQIMVSHAAFLAQVSPKAALGLVEEFEEAVGSLSSMPHRGAWFTGPYIPKNVYRFLALQKRYLILYQVQEGAVYVDYAADGRQEYPWLIG